MLSYFKKFIDQTKAVCKTTWNAVKKAAVVVKDACLAAFQAVSGFFGFGKSNVHSVRNNEWPKAAVSTVGQHESFIAKQRGSRAKHHKIPKQKSTPKVEAIASQEKSPQKVEAILSQEKSPQSLAMIPYQPNPFLQPLKFSLLPSLARVLSQKAMQFASDLPFIAKLVGKQKNLPAQQQEIKLETASKEKSSQSLAIIPYQPNPFLQALEMKSAPTSNESSQKAIMLTLDNTDAKSVDSDDENDEYFDAPDHFEDDDLSSESDDDNEEYFDPETSFEDESDLQNDNPTDFNNKSAALDSKPFQNENLKKAALFDEPSGLFQKSSPIKEDLNQRHTSSLTHYGATSIKIKG